MSKRFDAESILNRAAELHINISLDGDDLEIEAEAGMLKPNIVERIREYKGEIVDYLRTLIGPSLCATCLDAGLETVALSEAYDGLMYCPEHHPGQHLSPVEKAKQNPVMQEALRLFKGELDDSPARFSSPAEYVAHQKRELQRQNFSYRLSYSTRRKAPISRREKSEKVVQTLATSLFTLDK